MPISSHCSTTATFLCPLQQTLKQAHPLPLTALSTPQVYSKGIRLPNRKCCMMGNLESTSTWYILTMPLLTCNGKCVGIG